MGKKNQPIRWEYTQTVHCGILSRIRHSIIRMDGHGSPNLRQVLPILLSRGTNPLSERDSNPSYGGGDDRIGLRRNAL